MKREDRYIVIKRSDLEAAQAAGHVGHIEVAALNFVEASADRMRLERNKMPLKCVVVESDWPEYEHVWQMIAARVDGRDYSFTRTDGSSVSVYDAPQPETAWNGEGLPPVGATIEFTHSNFIKSFQENPRKTVWVKATVKYVSHSNFVYIDDEGIERARTDIELIRYRPLMTAEERYEHRKAKAVKAMLDIHNAPASEGLTREGVLEIIYAAIAAGDIPGVLAIKDDE